MHRYSSFLLLLILLAGLLVIHWPFHGISPSDRIRHEEISGRVDFVVDGDTFHIGRAIIRVWGINSPEKDHPYYLTARKAMQAYVEDQVITCLDLGLDKYQRHLGRCYDESGNSLSALMVRHGHAWDFTRYSNGTYRREEKQARQDGLGLWSSRPRRE